MPSIADQYRIITTGAGWIDRSVRGRVLFRGADAVPFLQALLSNDVGSLGPGRGVYATYLTPQGRMIADLRLYHRGDALLADVAPGTGAELASRFDQLIFSEDVQPADATAELAVIGVVGSDAPARLADALDADAGALGALELWQQVEVPGRSGAFVVRTDDAALPSFDVFVRSGDRDWLIEALGGAGITEMSAALAESLRVDAARPAFGVDMSEQTIPLEAGLLERAISTEKGCYVGQEVIIRMLHRGGGRVARRVSKLAMDPSVADAPEAGTAIVADGRDVGRVTSVARALDDSRWIALGVVHRDAAEVGRRLAVGAGETNAELTAFAGAPAAG